MVEGLRGRRRRTHRSTLAAHLPPTPDVDDRRDPAQRLPLPRPASRADIRLLGPLEVRYRGADVPIRAARVRRLLGPAAAAPRPRGVDRPARGRGMGQRPTGLGARSTKGARVTTAQDALARAEFGQSARHPRPTGYLIEVPDDCVDADRFEHAITSPRRDHSSRPESLRQAVEVCSAHALRLWRGAALSGIATSTYVSSEAARLRKRPRLNAIEDCISAEIGSGHARDVLGRAEALTVEHPPRANGCGRLEDARALPSSRPGEADALDCYQTLRRQARRRRRRARAIPRRGAGSTRRSWLRASANSGLTYGLPLAWTLERRHDHVQGVQVVTRRHGPESHGVRRPKPST